MIRAADKPRFDRLLTGSRLALVAGFGGLLVIVAIAGVDALRVLRQIRVEDDRIRTEFLRRNHLLNDIRSKLYLSGTYVRDYLLDPDPARAEGFRASLRQVRTEMDGALASYGGRIDAREAGQNAELRNELADYWDVIQPILGWNADLRHRDGYGFLRDIVFPRRTAMLDIASRIADLNEEQLNAGNERVVGLLTGFQARLGISLLATLALGVGMAVFSTSKILRLEAHAQARYEEVTALSARLVEAQETERRALSRELHDEVGQTLSAALVELRNLSDAPADRSRQQIEVIRGLIENTVRVIRDMSLLLRPSMLDDLGLIPALRWQAREASKLTGMDVVVDAEPAAELSDDYKTCIYRVVQEALHNCSRHSGASTVRIRVDQNRNGVAFSIEDDGRGFDVSQTKGLGLIGIEERVAHLGGSVRVQSRAGGGTTLSVELP